MENINEKISENMSKIKNKIIVMSGKGGVGKSTISTNLAYGLSLQGKRVGLLDADLHGPNVPIMLGIEGTRAPDLEKPYRLTDNLCCVSLSFYLKEPDSPIIWRGPLKTKTIKQMLSSIEWGELDYLVVDLPPGTGDEAITIAQDMKGGNCGSIIVTTPQEVALLDCHKAINFSKLLSVPVLGLVENMSGMVCPYCNEIIDIFKRGGGKKLSEKTDINYLGRIPLTQEIVEAGDTGNPYILNNIGGVAYEYFNSIIEKVEKKVEEERIKLEIRKQEGNL
jgi:ATP-binding protein involved in chromosome partitioning